MSFDMERPLYWIGIRESEIQDTHHLFAGSITIFGSGRNGNRSFEKCYNIRFDYNQDNVCWNHYVEAQAHEIICNDPDCVFMLYDAAELDAYGPEVAIRSVCKNPVALLELLADKFQSRQWLSEYVPILPYQMRYGTTFCMDDLKKIFPNVKCFVVQSAYSCGGDGTFLLTEENQSSQQFDSELRYAISPYLKNSISPNVHLIIYPHDTVILPPSIQLFDVCSSGLRYRGADFPMYRTLPPHVDQLLQRYAKKIGEVLRRAGYRGVCGIDFLYCNGTLYFVEINARFQSSTFLINRSMAQSGWKSSVHALHLEAFYCEYCNISHCSLEVPYSFYHYSYISSQREKLRYLYTLLKTISNHATYVVDDGLDWGSTLEHQTYLYKAVFEGSISALSPDGACRCDENVKILKKTSFAMDTKEDVERLKMLLLAHGIRLSGRAEHILSAMGGFNHEEFDAIDIALENRIYICVPYDTCRSWMSPFSVDADSNERLYLSCYGNRITDVSVRLSDAIGEMTTTGGILLRDIAYLSNDRLRIYQRLGCYFKDQNAGCSFCDVPKDERCLNMEDIFLAIHKYHNHPRIRHYLIGGGSCAPDDDFQTVIQIAQHIRDTTGKQIYLMSLPPQNPEILYALQESGITQVAFNLELYDRKLAQRYMPGKGSIPLSTYDQAFRTAVKIWGNTGNVRTIFVVGLEPNDSLLSGVEYVSRLGVAPILSLFRPAAGTPLAGFLPPSDNEIWEIYQRSKAICNRYDLELGPACPYCQDNTMVVTL